jgi:cyclohexyl-isocyanide hydratase
MVKVGMILFEGMTQLDLTGPLEVLSRLPDTKIYLVSRSLEPVKSDRGLTIVPDTSFENCPQDLTVLFVPGGPGVSGVLSDNDYLDFVRSRANSKYITSVCTGSIILAACGLLNGYSATTHWLSLDLLEQFNVKVRRERVVIDRNRITGGGVTSGIDFALTLAAEMFGEDTAKEVQLLIEYNPHPPFNSGHPDSADKSILTKVVEQRRDMQDRRRREIETFIAKHGL